MTRSLFRTVLAAFVAFTLVSSATVGAAGGLNFSNEAGTPNPWVEEDLTKEVHDFSTMDSVLEYEDDQGELTTLDATVNDSAANPYSYTATDANVSDFSAFPHSKDDVSALDAGEWSSGTGVSVSNIQTAPGVDALRVQTDGSMTSGDQVTATFSNFSVTADENKRYFQLALDVSTLESGATVEVRAVDENGDYKTAEINTSRSNGEDFIANSTGEGFVFQRQLGKMALDSSNGDGTFNNIESVEVVVQDADADISIAALNLEKMSKYQLGTEAYDGSDDNSEKDETRSIYEVKQGGPISITSLDTLGSAFSDARVHDVTIPVKFRAQDLAGEDIKAEWNETDAYPGYDYEATFSYRLELPSAYDLSHSDAELKHETNWPGERYLKVQYKEAAGDTAFDEISNWQDLTSQFDSQNKEITIDSTVSPDQSLVLQYQLKLTSEEKQTMQSSGMGAVGPMGGGSGGLFGWLFGTASGLVTTVAGLFAGWKIGLPKLRGIMG